jgi:hypothetical protein
MVKIFIEFDNIKLDQTEDTLGTSALIGSIYGGHLNIAM